jgi:hypothetical protein
MKLLLPIFIVLIAYYPVWSQVDNAPLQSLTDYGVDGNWSSTGSNDDRMQAPPPVSGQIYPNGFTSKERSNYLRAGVTFTGAYIDNLVEAAGGYPIGDISYSVEPSITLDETTSRLHALLTYAPGFTFYQRTTSLDQADQNALIGLQYRLSPHVTFSARDGFLKSSSVFNQADLTPAGTVSGGAQEANFSVIAPFAGFLRNVGYVGISYQFSMNSMVGASGMFTNLHYSNQSQVSGLYDSSSQSGSAFYTFRISRRHYLGTIYQYQRLLSYPTGQPDETQTHAIIFFYALVPSRRLSMSFFGGPQHADTVQPPLPPAEPQTTTAKSWTPAAGASFSWQTHLTSLAVSYSHSISSGAGLIGAVRLDSGKLELRQRFTKTLSASASGMYAQNDVLGTLLPGTYSGHSIFATVSLRQQLLQKVALELGYSRLHQDYNDVGALSGFPDTNREFISLSYQFAKPLGR